MIDRSDAVNLARTWKDSVSGRCQLTSIGIDALADAVLRMDEYIRQSEAEQQSEPQHPVENAAVDARRYRWLRENELVAVGYNAEVKNAAALDEHIDAAMRQSDIEERK